MMWRRCRSVLVCLGLVVAGCGARDRAEEASPAEEPAALERAAVTRQPPEVPFTPPEPWTSRGEPSTTVAPPDPDEETWRVLANQYEPMQEKTPVWQPLPASETVDIELLPDSGFRCIVTPLRFEPIADDFGTELEAWLLRRDLLCSADGWRSWTEHPHVVRVRPDGTHKRTPATRANLREHDPDHGVRETTVLIRDDEKRRAATTGPPQLLPGAADDD